MIRMIRRTIAAVMMIFAAAAGVLSAEENARGGEKENEGRKPPIVQVESFPVDADFIGRVGAADLFRRDMLLASRMGVLIESTATVKLVEEYTLFRKKYRIVAKMEPYAGVTIQYHIYTDNAEYLTFLSEGQKFSFKGQYVMMTPVNSRRDFYILDVILQEGAAVVE